MCLEKIIPESIGADIGLNGVRWVCLRKNKDRSEQTLSMNFLNAFRCYSSSVKFLGSASAE